MDERVPMSNRFLSALLITSSLALAANEPRVDAFLSRRETRALVDPRGMTSVGRAAFTAGLVSSIEPRYGVPLLAIADACRIQIEPRIARRLHRPRDPRSASGVRPARCA